MSKPSRPAHDARERTSGRYAKSPPCDGCGKPVGTGYFTDDEVCGGGDGPGFYLCERKRCVTRLQPLGVEDRRRLYTEQRTANERTAEAEDNGGHVPGCECVDPPNACALHAAAPDLLEACEAALRSFKQAHYCRHRANGGSYRDTPVDNWCECDTVRAAIAKARGSK